MTAALTEDEPETKTHVFVEGVYFHKSLKGPSKPCSFPIPIPPNIQRLPDASTQLAAPYRPPG